MFFFFQAEDGIRDRNVTGVQTCALPIYPRTRGGRTLGGNGAVEVMGSQEREGHRQTRAGEWGSCRGGRGRPWFPLARDLDNHAFSAEGGVARRIQVFSPAAVRELLSTDL